MVTIILMRGQVFRVTARGCAVLRNRYIRLNLFQKVARFIRRAGKHPVLFLPAGSGTGAGRRHASEKTDFAGQAFLNFFHRKPAIPANTTRPAIFFRLQQPFFGAQPPSVLQQSLLITSVLIFFGTP